MENKKETIFQFEFDEESREHLKNISQWAIAIAVMSFISLGITAMEFVKGYSSIFALDSSNEVGFCIDMWLTILLNVYLFNTGRHFKKAVDQTEPGSLAKGMATLRTYYKIYGMILIALVALAVLYVLFVTFFNR